MKSKKMKRVAALLVVVFWAILLITTLVVAFFDTEACHTLFQGLIFTDIVLPVVVYAIMLAYKYLSKRGQ